jgi:hypothetical protein
MKTVALIVGYFVLIVGVVLASPLLSAAMFLVGAFFGWLIANVFTFFGVWIVSGVALFGLHITLADLPLFVATLGFIGGFFRQTSTNSSKK